MTLDIEKLISEIDLDGSGEIDFEEFRLLLTQWPIQGKILNILLFLMIL